MRKKLLVLFVMMMIPICSFSADLLNNSAKRELKKLLQTEIIHSNNVVKGLDIGIDLVTFERLLNSQGDVWIKKTRWNEIWLEKFKVKFSRNSKEKDRILLGATLRYRTYTKNIFKPSRRWRTASYVLRLQGSAKISLAKGKLQLGDFRVNLIDLKNFPG